MGSSLKKAETCTVLPFQTYLLHTLYYALCGRDKAFSFFRLLKMVNNHDSGGELAGITLIVHHRTVFCIPQQLLVADNTSE